ncbi:MAG TPA: nucleotidyl transferase AbiEii/AbiGii toxin family protein, partial [Saprospiraceae bacterium]|nr:nucleotidyl transferase AbiEii/AbiGii toxin family protein [Saprospiraceae bacterium]
MNKWLALPDDTKRNAYIQIAEKTGMSPFAVEKDWWVVQALTAIFEMEVAKHLVFKGGTSLSKAWNLIQRFSEDIDLAIDREYLGFKGDLSKSQLTRLRKAASLYTSGPFFEALKAKFQEKGISVLEFKVVEANNSDQDPRIIEVFYPNVIDAPGYMQPKIQIEIGCRSLKEPYTNQSISSLVYEEYADRDFTEPPITVPTVNPERTFLEKIFLLHEEFQKATDVIRVNRLSRHLYDIVKLSKSPFAEMALIDKELYNTIVNHRHKFTRVGGVNYNLHHPSTINIIPNSEILKKWEDDYKTMVDYMIYELEPPSFDEIITELTILKNRINALPWELDMDFPISNSKGT